MSLSLGQAVQADVEESRVETALIELAVVIDASAPGLPEILSHDDTAAAATKLGRELWQRERERVQGGLLDDRRLYWRRLFEKQALRAACAEPALCAEALQAFELASRGIGQTDGAPAALRIALSGFDPFQLDKHIGQSNPSGVIALALDGALLESGGRTARVEAVVFPVRFEDFDAGMVEAVFGPLLEEIDMLVTVSMGRKHFDLERFPGRRRSATAPDNQRVRTGASRWQPLVPMLGEELLAGPEFVEFSLPVQRMRMINTPYQVRDNRSVTTLPRGLLRARSLSELRRQTAVRGSGGGYLSNEISYRTVRLVRSSGRAIPVGHIHTPNFEGYDANALDAILGQTRQMLEAALPAVGDGRDTPALR